MTLEYQLAEKVPRTLIKNQFQVGHFLDMGSGDLHVIANNRSDLAAKSIKNSGMAD